MLSSNYQFFFILCSAPNVIWSISTSKVQNRISLSDVQTNIRTLIIDNYDSYTYNIWQSVATCDSVEPLVVLNDEFDGSWTKLIASIPEFQNIIISPGPGRPDVASDFGLSMDAILKADVPILGVCLGHQGIAHAYGGAVVGAKLPMHGRLSSIRHTSDGLFKGISQYENVVRYHSLIVDNPLPLALRPTAWTEDGTIMALQHHTKPIYGVQFHPESVSTNCGHKIFSNFFDITMDYHLRNREIDRDRNRGIKKKMYSMMTPHNYLRPPKDWPQQQPISPAALMKHINVHVSRVALDESVSIPELFTELYGDHAAAFWLDSSDQSAASRHNNGSCLSLLGAIDTPDAYVVEYDGSNRIHLHYGSGITLSKDGNIFEFLKDEITNSSQTITIDDSCAAGECHALPFDPTAAFFGFLSYEARHEAQRILKSSTSGSRISGQDRRIAYTYEERTAKSPPPTATTGGHRDVEIGDDGKSGSSVPTALFFFPSTYIVRDHTTSSTFIVGVEALSHTSFPSHSTKQPMTPLRERDSDVTARPKASTVAASMDLLKSRMMKVVEDRKLKQKYSEKLPAVEATNGYPQQDISKDSDPSVVACRQPPRQTPRYQMRSSLGRKGYADAISTCMEHISLGETYEVCLTDTFRGPCPLPHLQLYKRLRSVNPAPYSAFLHYDLQRLKNGAINDETCLPGGTGGLSVCCSSPERYLRASKVIHCFSNQPTLIILTKQIFVYTLSYLCRMAFWRVGQLKVRHVGYSTTKRLTGKPPKPL